MNVNENNSLGLSAKTMPNTGTNDTGHLMLGVVSTRQLIEPIFMKTFFISFIAALLFACLGSSNILAPFDVQAQRLVRVLAWIWPVLPIQYELVRQVQGVGQSASYAFMCAALWAWPLICAIAYFRGHIRCQKKILPISAKEIGQFIVVFPFAVLVLVFDTTRVASPLFGFQVNHPTVLYLRQWFLFALTAVVLGILLYVLGRIILERIWRQAA
jgi:hypothetical protein